MEKNYLNEFKIAEEFLEIAKKNLDSSLRTSANRLYFALEKAVIAYFYFKKLKIPKNHQKLWEMSAELLGEEYYSLLRILYDLRMQADYGNISVFVDLNAETIKENIDKVEFLINKLNIKMDKFRVKSPARSFRDLEVYQSTIQLSNQLTSLEFLNENLSQITESIPRLIAESSGDRFDSKELAEKKLSESLTLITDIITKLDLLRDKFKDESEKKEILDKILTSIFIKEEKCLI
ncbi:MAG: HEPN domain-containing protein [Nanoarchaeota archaeon]|nr:HEPN domain-containing protein [Nanoarchaeota archaeon]